mmetsp:Transcript_121230/g.339491  ORF Transcript_121230/g.339491 Transcript_121230/m.339491 type:complete len:188 (+) Transcript_121230:81-644(+)
MAQCTAARVPQRPRWADIVDSDTEDDASPCASWCSSRGSELASTADTPSDRTSASDCAVSDGGHDCKDLGAALADGWGDAWNAASEASPVAEGVIVAAADGKAATAEAGQLPSAGSAGHEKGHCKPCVLSVSWEGCAQGAACRFCHFTHPMQKGKRMSKSKRQRLSRKYAENADMWMESGRQLVGMA